MVAVDSDLYKCRESQIMTVEQRLQQRKECSHYLVHVCDSATINIIKINNERYENLYKFLPEEHWQNLPAKTTEGSREPVHREDYTRAHDA